MEKMSKEVMLMYQKALLTSKDNEIRKLKIELGKAEAEIMYWKNLKSNKPKEPEDPKDPYKIRKLSLIAKRKRIKKELRGY